MSEFHYVDGVLHAEAVSLEMIAQEVGTPFYCYSSADLESRYKTFADALSEFPATICFACKANSNQAVLSLLAAKGSGADVVSGGELARALAAGIPPSKIVFSGVGKTDGEIRDALAAGILQINAESESELRTLSAIASQAGKTIPVALRVNPDVDANTHAKISTGKSENKFGIDLPHALEVYGKGASLPGIDMQGVAVHIGSQLTDLSPFREAFAKIADLVTSLRANGHKVERIDLGGGVGIVYADEAPPDLSEYAAIIRDEIMPLECQLVFEPGRFIAGPSGVLVTRVLRVKDGVTRRFLIVDAAMNDLLRPALYDAHHDILPVKKPQKGMDVLPVDVVGPICETGDTFAKERDLPPLGEGDLVAIVSAGAYGAVMSSNYNTRPLPAEVMVRSVRYDVVRPRQSVADLMALDAVPDWLKEPDRA